MSQITGDMQGCYVSAVVLLTFWLAFFFFETAVQNYQIDDRSNAEVSHVQSTYVAARDTVFSLPLHVARNSMLH